MIIPLRADAALRLDFFDFKKVYYFYKIKNVNIFSEEYP